MAITDFLKLTPEPVEAKRKRLEAQRQEKDLGKQLTEVESNYKEGLTTLKDIIAPAALKFESSYFELNGKFARSFFVLAYPRFLSTGWLSFIINSEGSLDISMFITTID